MEKAKTKTKKKRKAIRSIPERLKRLRTIMNETIPDELYCHESLTVDTKEPAPKIKVEAPPPVGSLDAIEMAWENILGYSCQIAETSKLEHWLVDHHVPTFETIPSPWYVHTRIFFQPMDHNHPDPVYLCIGAYCRKRRLCLCSSNGTSIFCVDADELFAMSHLSIDKTFPANTFLFDPFAQSCSPLTNQKVFPIRFSITPLSGDVSSYCSCS